MLLYEMLILIAFMFSMGLCHCHDPNPSAAEQSSLPLNETIFKSKPLTTQS